MKAVPAAAQFESLGHLLSRHRAITRVSLAALSFIVLTALSQQSPAQAGPGSAPSIPDSLLPQNVGLAVATDASITIPFDAPMDPTSVESALQIMPSQDVQTAWNEDHSALTILPERLWRTDERYIIVVAESSSTTDGLTLGSPRRFTFTTNTAPAVADFQVRIVAASEAESKSEIAATLSTRTRELEVDPALDAARSAEATPIGPGALSKPPTQTADAVSASSSISIAFSAPMDREDVQDSFTINPAAAGDLSWSGDNLVFTPDDRLTPGGRYTISLAGAHDRLGNVIGGKTNFSFVVQAGAQVTKTSPERDGTDVQPDAVEMWFSQPMDVDATNGAFKLVDTATGDAVPGKLTWNEDQTQLTFTPDSALAEGRKFVTVLGKGARDVDANVVTAKWAFTTHLTPVAAPVARSEVSTRTAPAPVVPPPAPATSLAGYALNQVNAARAAYGFAPVVLDSSISAVAYAHAYDQAVNGYFSHYGLDGSTRESRLRAGGVSFGWSGENQCYLVGRSAQATLDWCHAQFMAEPYPGQFNHIANVLSPNAHRMGVGIAIVGSKIVIVWDFTD
ncbi:MAG TPA: Ig-like domain-containing protein [Candidatus Limnocylindria bacterium]|nr:Ig-like domain-containing protein [Candidatus Limnocylindria bacterium]